MIGHMEDRRHISLVSCYFALWIDGIERAISRRNVKETIVDLQNVTTDSLHEQVLVVLSFVKCHIAALNLRTSTSNPKPYIEDIADVNP